jgi:hypothetical protein
MYFNRKQYVNHHKLVDNITEDIEDIEDIEDKVEYKR